MKKNLPIKLFQKRKELDQRFTEGGGGNEPSWLLTSEEAEIKASEFTRVLSTAAAGFESRKPERNFIPKVIKVEINPNATAKSHRDSIGEIFSTSTDSSIIGFVNETDLLVRMDAEEDAQAISKKLNNIDKYKLGISAIDNIQEYKPDIFIKEVSKKLTVKLKLINFHESRLNRAIERLFEGVCEKNKIVAERVTYAPGLIIYRVSEVSQDALSELSTFEALEELGEMPTYSVDDVPPAEAESAKFEVFIPKPNVEYPIVGVLDSGISSNPHLAPWLLDEKFIKVPENRINTAHGTFVAGILLYGDEFLGDLQIGHEGFKIFDATVMPDPTLERIEEWELIANIRLAIESRTDIKIWNLSLGTAIEAERNKFSDFGQALDDIQQSYNVVICKSAGNCQNYKSGLPVSRVAKSADSIMSLVVGSIAHVQGKYDLSPDLHPSPFSRIGPAPAYINKPDLTHIGGNAGINDEGTPVESGVDSFTPDGKITSRAGTSFSTPRITSLLAGISQKLNQESNPLLLKALAIHSAKYPELLTTPIADRIKFMGYGIPQKVNEIIYNDDHEVTLILQDTLEKGRWIEIRDFPFPSNLIHEGYFYGQITITLVANPVLSDANGRGVEYCQSNLDVRFGTFNGIRNRDGRINPIGVSDNKNLLNPSFYSAAYSRANPAFPFSRERMLIKYGNKYQPIKKYAIDLEEMKPAQKNHYLQTNRNWFLHVFGLYRDFAEKRAIMDGTGLNQDFCLVVTIKDPKRNFDVYTRVTEHLNERNFIHSNVKIQTDVHVSVSSNQTILPNLPEKN